MKQRVITGILFGLVVIALMVIRPESRLLLLGLIPILSFYEFSRITKFVGKDWLISLLLVVGISVFIYVSPEVAKHFCLGLFGVLNVWLIYNLYGDLPSTNLIKAKSIIGPLYIIAPFILAISIGWHKPIHILISLMLLIWTSDSAAYFVGSQIGKRKFFPSISPKKTWEGFWGAGMVTLLVAFGIHSYFAIGNWTSWVIFALIVWVLGALGDLIASQVKRSYAVKDSGSILPGHGGFYDRFDAFIFVIPFLLILFELTNFGI